jgi:hypothetical protein
LLNLRAIPGAIAIIEQLGLEYTYAKSEKMITINGYGFIVFRSYDNPLNIVAFSVAHSIIDELDTLPKRKAELVWRKISERTRQKIPGVKNTISVVTSPDQGVSGFCYEKWGGDTLPTGYRLIQASTRSNPYLPKDYVEQILANYDPILANAFIDGEFVSLTRNKVYHFFSRLIHHTDRLLDANDNVVHIGLDFNIGACVAIVFVIDNNNPIVVDEFTSYDTHDFVNNLQRLSGKQVIVYPDASGDNRSANASQSSLNIIRNAGYQVNARSSNPAIRDRINAVNSLLSHDRLKINTTKSPRLTAALESQGYNEQGEPEKGNVHPEASDWCDALGYMLFTVFGIKIKTATVKVNDIPNTQWDSFNNKTLRY